MLLAPSASVPPLMVMPPMAVVEPFSVWVPVFSFTNAPMPKIWPEYVVEAVLSRISVPDPNCTRALAPASEPTVWLPVFCRVSMVPAARLMAPLPRLPPAPTTKPPALMDVAPV
ncbi:hypothetical protein D3C73_1083390 [compost metagenome]